jgi:outer membrane protein OmpA-like peptidoglycan-associated protein
MRHWIAAALALLTVACAAQKPGVQSAEPGFRSSRERITLLPGPDGKVGKVIVSAVGDQVTLDSAFSTAEVRGNTLTKSEAEKAASRARIDVALAALPQRPRKYRVFYMLDALALTSASAQDLDAIKRDVADFPAPEVIVTGHADRLGTTAYNDALSLRRARQMRDILLGAGVAPEKILVVARGEREPLVTTPDNISEPRNRRVEIKVR